MLSGDYEGRIEEEGELGWPEVLNTQNQNTDWGEKVLKG